jgi:hypothetical protein
LSYQYFGLPVGFFLFIKEMSEDQDSFGYSVYPESGYELAATKKSWLSMMGAGGEAEGLPAAGSYFGAEQSSSVERSTRIAGYSSQLEVPDGPAIPLFGWYVIPTDAVPSRWGKPRMKPHNQVLTAHVSVPAWWRRAAISWETCWIEPEQSHRGMEDCKHDKESGEFEISLPTRYDLISNVLLDARQRPPLVNELEIPQTNLMACQPARLQIAGQRLWRSAIVTLGGQKADLIQVMPDMEGILAQFDEVQPPRSVARIAKGASAPTSDSKNEKGVLAVPLSIWTSEGHQQIYDRINIVIPELMEKRIAEGAIACPPRETSGESKVKSSEPPTK